MSSRQTPTIVALGVAAALGAAVAYKKLKVAKKKDIKITYFDLAATPGEKLRLALCLTVGKGGFTDDRVAFKDWPARKAAMKYGQMPCVTIDGVDNFQSGALLRHIGATFGDGSLYPLGDSGLVLKIEEMLGVAEDLQRDFMPALYVGMRPGKLGHGELEGDAKKAKVKQMREAFLTEDLPKHMEFISAALQTSKGGFIAGTSHMTIADCQLLPQLYYFTKGVADYVPKDCLEPWPQVTAYIARMRAVPAIKEWYGL